MKAALPMAVVVALVASACTLSSESDTDPAAPDAAAPTTSGATPASKPKRLERGRFEVTPKGTVPQESLPAFGAVKLTDANYPAGLAAAPDGRILYSELWGGLVRVIRRDGTLDPEPWADVNRLLGIRWVELFHGGLSGIAFDPEYERNRFVYVVTQIPSERTGFAKRTYVIRFTGEDGRGQKPKVILRIPASKFDNTYSLVFGPDEMLYVPAGFLGTQQSQESDPLADPRGKILRVTRTGKAPGDNPFGNRAPRVWAAGFKNTFDLAFFPGRSDIAVGGENGTVGHDEINLLMPGHHYGYPRHEGITRSRRFTPPLLDFGADSPAPVGVVYYTGRRHPALRNRFLMCNNDGGMVALRIRRSDPGRLLTMTPVVAGCTLDVVQTPDGSIVFSDPGGVYRLVPG